MASMTVGTIPYYRPPQLRRQENKLWHDAAGSSEQLKGKLVESPRRLRRIRADPWKDTRSLDSGQWDQGKGRRRNVSNPRVTVTQNRQEVESSELFDESFASNTQSESKLQASKQPSKYPPHNGRPRNLNIVGSRSPIRIVTTAGPELTKSVPGNHRISNSSEQMAGPLKIRDLPSKDLVFDVPSPRNPGSNENQHQNVGMRPMEWQRIRYLRFYIWRLRSKIHDMRLALRQQQQIKSSADNVLLQRITVQELEAPSQMSQNRMAEKSIPQLMQDSRDARDVYGPLEDDCTQLEDNLTRHEFELTRLEERLYGHSSQHSTIDEDNLPLPSSHSQSSRQDNSLIEDSDDEDESPKFHPLVKEFLSATGDLDLLRERLYELLEEKAALDDKRESRERFGLSLPYDEQDFLNNFQSEHDNLVKDIQQLEVKVEGLKQDCLFKGLIDQDGEPLSDFQSWERSSFIEDEGIDSKGQVSEYVRYPVLLPVPEFKKKEVLKQSDWKPATKSDSTAGRVNGWLLDRLRTSPLDVSLLARTFERLFGEPNDQWELAVLSLWYDDGTTTSTSEVRVYTSSTSLTMQVPHGSTKSF